MDIMFEIKSVRLCCCHLHPYLILQNGQLGRITADSGTGWPHHEMAFLEGQFWSSQPSQKKPSASRDKASLGYVSKQDGSLFRRSLRSTLRGARTGFVIRRAGSSLRFVQRKQGDDATRVVHPHYGNAGFVQSSFWVG